MGQETSRRLVFDIETSALPEAAEYLIEPIEAPSNWKDPAKIQAYIANAMAEQLAKCALDPDLCRIVAIGLMVEGEGMADCLTTEHESEANILEWFWREAGGRHLVGFNCLAFDLPVLFRRSLYLGVKTPQIQIDKYRHPEVTDLQQFLSHNGTLKWRGLSFYAKRFGIEDTDTIDGADIGQAVAEGRWQDVKSHCLSDVRKTAAVAERCGLFQRARADAEVF